MYPVLQAHVNDPAVFVQAALLSQLWVFRVHSLLSKRKKKQDINITSLYINEFREMRGIFAS